MCGFGGIISSLIGAVSGGSDKSEKKARRAAEAETARLKAERESEKVAAESKKVAAESKRKKKRAERQPTETIIGGSSDEGGLGA